MIPISKHSPSEEISYHQKASEAPNSKVSFTALTIIQPEEGSLPQNSNSVFIPLTASIQDPYHSDGEDSLGGLGNCFKTLCDKDFDETTRLGATCSPKNHILPFAEERARTSRLYDLNEDPAFRAAGKGPTLNPSFPHSAFIVNNEPPLESKKRERQEDATYKTAEIGKDFFFIDPPKSKFAYATAPAGPGFFSSILEPAQSNVIKRPRSPSALDTEHQNKKSPPSITSSFSPVLDDDI